MIRSEKIIFNTAIEHTGIFTPNLKELLFQCIQPSALPAPENGRIYGLEVLFDELQCYDTEGFHRFHLPKEALPRYLRDREYLTADEKRSQVLSYQLREAERFFEEKGFVLGGCSITGAWNRPERVLNIQISECGDWPEQAASGKKKDGCPMKVYSIMPSMSSFARNLASLAAEWEKHLITAVGDEAAYRTWERRLGWTKIHSLYARFKEEYNTEFIGSSPEKAALRKEFLKLLEQESRRAESTSPDHENENGAAAGEGGQRKAQKNGEKEGKHVSGQKPLTVIFTLSVFKRTKSGKRGKTCAGYLDLESDGREICFTYRGKGKHAFPEPVCPLLLNEKEKTDGHKLCQSLQLALEQTNRELSADGYELEIERFYEVVVFMDLKGMMKKLRTDRLLNA